MKRSLYKQLLIWKKNKKRKPLLLQGARQVGKTYLIKEFGENEYKECIYLNFEQDSALESLFNTGLQAKKILNNISLYFGKKINPNEALIFFDEIQIAPKVLTSLKYFCEEAPNYHIIAAGSLLGVSIGKENSFPVGKVNFMTLYPMSFIEYLLALGEDVLVEKLSLMKKAEPLPNIIHEKLLRLFKLYLYIGGMPEVLQNYLDEQDIANVRILQNEILEAYQRDFSKYTGGSQALKIGELWQSIPQQLSKENKKFKFNDVRKKARATTFEQTVEWLNKAGLINVVYNISTAKLPLAGYANNSKFKIYLHDTGLLGAMLNLNPSIIIHPNEVYSEYNGAFIENFVANELLVSGMKNLFYWTSNNQAEVDFILQKDNNIIPLEVKSGLNRNIKSLRSYANKYQPKFIYRSSPRNFTQDQDFVNIPLYASFLMAQDDFK